MGLPGRRRRQLQDQLGLSATRAGLPLPVGVGIVLAGALLVTPLRRRFGSVPVAVAGLASRPGRSSTAGPRRPAWA